MYLPASFAESRLDVLHELMRAHPFAALITHGISGILANHIPVQTLDAPPLGILRGHIARANPLWKEQPVDRQALVLFQGPDTYISPSLYPSKLQTGKAVPTWNYVVVQARGTLRFIHDKGELRQLVASLTDAHEAAREHPWKIDDAPASYIDGMLGAIVGFEMVVTDLAGKWKISQNRDATDAQAVASALEAAPDADSRALGKMLTARIQP